MSSSVTSEEDLLNRKFEQIALNLRISLHSHGFISKDPQYGIETIRAKIPIEPSLGLELLEVANDNRGHGLVLVSHVGGNAADHTTIQVGDTIVGVSCAGANLKESVAGLDYEETIEAIGRAKTHAQSMTGDASISLELNRLVPRAKVQVIVEGANSGDKPILLKGLAGDNLRLLLRKNKVDCNSTTSNCGGEGICGSCMVEILEGESSLNKSEEKGSKTQKKRPASLRNACQTIVGADNQESTVRVRLFPQ